jgi:hypothetical protein
MARTPAARIFISHAHANVRTARRIQAALQSAGHDPWLDETDIGVGKLLRKELQRAIAGSRVVVVVWSKAAAQSRWVAAELLTAFHLNRLIVPCVLDGTTLPQFLSRSIFTDLRRPREEALEKLGRQLKAVGKGRNEFPEAVPYQAPELMKTIDRLYTAMKKVTTAPDAKRGRVLQKKLDPEMHAAEKRWRFDSTILNLAGYHRKNAYMYKHWDEFWAGRYPADRLLEDAEWLFYNSLFVNPLDMSAVNGLGNILLFSGELQGALFFVERAIGLAHRAGVSYPEAESDRRVIRERMGLPPDGKTTHA